MPRQLSKNRLRELREAHDLKLWELSAVAERDASMIHRYETGTTRIPDDLKLRLAEHFGVTVAYLMGWDEEEVAA